MVFLFWFFFKLIIPHFLSSTLDGAWFSEWGFFLMHHHPRNLAIKFLLNRSPSFDTWRDYWPRWQSMDYRANSLPLETWHGGRGQGPIISEGHQRSMVRSNFKLLRLSSNLGRVMLDRGWVQNAYQGGCPPRSSEVKGQVNFKVAWTEPKLREGNARPRTSAKCVSSRTPSEVKWGHRSGQISSSSDGA